MWFQKLAFYSRSVKKRIKIKCDTAVRVRRFKIHFCDTPRAKASFLCACHLLKRRKNALSVRIKKRVFAKRLRRNHHFWFARGHKKRRPRQCDTIWSSDVSRVKAPSWASVFATLVGPKWGNWIFKFAQVLANLCGFFARAIHKLWFLKLIFVTLLRQNSRFW